MPPHFHQGREGGQYNPILTNFQNTEGYERYILLQRFGHYRGRAEGGGRERVRGGEITQEKGRAREEREHREEKCVRGKK